MPNRAQKHFDENKHNRNIILKSRQLGFTTYECIDMFDDTLWTPDFNCLMLSYDGDSQLDLFDKKIDYAWQNLAPELRALYDLDADRANQLKFKFGSGSFSSIQVRTRGRSGTFRRVHISELGKIAKEDPRKAREILSGTIQAVPLDGRVDIESTAEGDVGLFADMFWEAFNRGEPKTPVDYKAHFYNWTWDDGEMSKIIRPEKELPKKFREYQKKYSLSDKEITYYYYKWLTLGRDWDLLRQEYPTTPEEAFVSSGTKLFNPSKIIEMPTEDGERVGDWIYYEDFVPGHRYGLGADIAEGTGQDSSTIVIIDFDYQHPESKRIIPKVVAEYENNTIQPDIFAYEIKNGATRYGNCITAPERNGMAGGACITRLKDIYFNIYTEYRTDKEENIVTEKLGWSTNKATKPKMFYDLSTAVNNFNIIIPSKRIKREAHTYNREDLGHLRFDIDRTIDSEEQTGHWDLLTACAIAYQTVVDAIPSEIKGDSEVEDNDGDVLERFGILGRT